MSKLQRSYQNYLVIAILFFLPFYFVRLRYGWISLNLIEILILILVALWFFDRKTKAAIRCDKCFRGYMFPTALIIAGIILSIIANKNFYIGLGILKGWFVFPILFTVILHDLLKKDHELLTKIFFTLFASGFIVSLFGIYYKFFGILTYDGRLRVFYDSPNQLAMFLAPIFLIGIIKFGFEELPRFYRGKKKPELWESGLIVGGIFLMAFNLYLTKSYGAWLSVGGVLAFVFWLKYRSLALNKKYLLFPLIIFIVFLFWVGIDKYKQIEKLDERSSLASRVMIWKSAGAMIGDNPFFGIGAGNFQNKYLEYQKNFPPYLEWSVPQPHNLFLAFWLEAGLAGLFGFILLLVQFFKDSKKAIMNNRSSGILCLALILYFILHGLVDTTYWRNDIAVIFWLTISINLYLASGKFSESSKAINL